MIIPDRDTLSKTVDVAPWDILRSHLERGGIIIAHKDLDLSEVAHAIATDQKLQVERWLANSLISKPSLKQVTAWDSDRQKLFSVLVISPFVVVQEVFCAG